MKQVIQTMYDSFVEKAKETGNYTPKEGIELSITQLTMKVLSIFDATNGFHNEIRPLTDFEDLCTTEISSYPVQFQALCIAVEDEDKNFTHVVFYILPIKNQQYPDLEPEDGFRLIFE